MYIKKVNNYWSYFLLGMFGFSILGQYLILDIFKFPIMLIEIFYIPFLFKYRTQIMNNFLTFKIRKSYLIPVYFMLILGLLIGIILEGFHILLSYRSILYIILTYSITRKYGNKIDINILRNIFIGSIIGEGIYIMLLPPSKTAASMNILSIVGSLTILLLQEKLFLSISLIIFIFIISIKSGYRIGLIGLFLTLIIIFVINLFKNKKFFNPIKMLYKSVFIFIGLCCFIYIKENLIDIVNYISEVTNMGSFATFRVTTRLEGLINLDFEISQDTDRLKIYRYIIDDFSKCILPRGIIDESNGNIWRYIDIPVLYLYDAIGSISTLILLIVILLKYIKSLFIYLKTYSEKYNSKEYIIVMFPILIFLIIVNGTFMVTSYQSILTGMILGILFSPNSSQGVTKNKKLIE